MHGDVGVVSKNLAAVNSRLRFGKPHVDTRRDLSVKNRLEQDHPAIDYIHRAQKGDVMTGGHRDAGPDFLVCDEPLFPILGPEKVLSKVVSRFDFEQDERPLIAPKEAIRRVGSGQLLKCQIEKVERPLDNLHTPIVVNLVSSSLGG